MEHFGIDDLLRIAIDKEASDLHLKVGSPPSLRVYGDMFPIEDMPVLTPEDTERLIMSILEEHQRDTFADDKELDIAYELPDCDWRFRVNVFLHRKAIGSVLRLIPVEVPTIDGWGLPQILKDLCEKERGFILFTGPTGYGKSTTLAAMVDHINHHRRCHIVTLEDPIEFVFEDDLSHITQREVGDDTHSFLHALERVLRQDPNVIMVGEMRDPETMATALTAAETGHLVMSTLHTNSAAESIDRVIDVFPPHQQNQIRVQLAATVEAIICQTLVPRRTGFGRLASFEIMLATPAVRNLIRESETHQIINVIQTNVQMGMQTRDQSLRAMYEKGLIAYETALAYASDPEELRRATTFGGKVLSASGRE